MGASLVACFMKFRFRLSAGIACGKVSRAPPCTRKGHRPLTRFGIITFLSFGADEKISHALIFSSHGRRVQSNGFFRGRPWLLGYLPGVCERFFTATSVLSP